MSTDEHEHPRDDEQERGRQADAPPAQPGPGPDDDLTAGRPDGTIVFDGQEQTGPYSGPRRRP